VPLFLIGQIAKESVDLTILRRCCGGSVERLAIALDLQCPLEYGLHRYGAHPWIPFDVRCTGTALIPF